MNNTIFLHKLWRSFLDCMPQLFFIPKYIVTRSYCCQVHWRIMRHMPECINTHLVKYHLFITACRRYPLIGKFGFEDGACVNFTCQHQELSYIIANFTCHRYCLSLIMHRDSWYTRDNPNRVNMHIQTFYLMWILWFLRCLGLVFLREGGRFHFPSDSDPCSCQARGVINIVTPIIII